MDQEENRMSSLVDLFGLQKRYRQLKELALMDATPLMRTWMNVVDKDNRRGILAGLDKDGIPMLPVSYRPRPPGPFRVTQPPKGKHAAEMREELKRHRLGQSARRKKGEFAGFGPYSSGLHNNLMTSQYRLLGGPPLAPRDQFSRVITNLKTTFTSPALGASYWSVIGAWDQVVDVKGMPFLWRHFNGIGVPRRDLRGVRPNGQEEANEALQNWARLAIREHFSGH
jgi:hypothetical protein